MAAQARKILGPEVPLSPTGLPSLMPAAMRPSRLPPLPSTLRPLGGVQDKGKGPSNGRQVPKKGSPYTSSEEDVREERPSAARPLVSPPFRTTRPLQPLGGVAPLPPVGSAQRLPPLQIQSPISRRIPLPTAVTGSMPPRRLPLDPFAAAVAPLSPTRVTPAPLSPIRSPPGRAPPTPIRSPPGRAPPTPVSVQPRPPIGVNRVHPAPPTSPRVVAPASPQGLVPQPPETERPQTEPADLPSNVQGTATDADTK